MPIYKYTAVDESGKKYSGAMTVADENVLYDRLKQDRKILVTSKQANKAEVMGKLKTASVADFCRQLGTLLGSGVSLVRALTIIANEENLKPGERKVYTGLLQTIRKGVPLSDAMNEQAPAFPELLVNMLRSAEVSGNIDKTAKRMAEHYEKENKINQKVKNSMIYPIILVIMMVAIIIFVNAYILPQFSEIFAMMSDLPWTTKVIIGVSDAITNRWYVIIGVVAAVIIVWKLLLKVPRIRIGWDHLKLKVPGIGKLLRTIYTGRFARTLSSLYGSGVPIINSMATAARTVGNKYIESQFPLAIESVQKGETLSRSIKGIDGFEKKLISSINVGEETGNLDEMLDVMADTYDYESEMAIDRLVKILEPVMLIILGVLVGFIMLGVITPIYGSYNAIAQQGTY
jgi:type IV pilus assembly protein PilC